MLFRSARTAEFVKYAHERGISVEAEVGHIGTTEDNMTKEEEKVNINDLVDYLDMHM